MHPGGSRRPTPQSLGSAGARSAGGVRVRARAPPREIDGAAAQERMLERIHPAGAAGGIVDELRVGGDTRAGGVCAAAPRRRARRGAPSSLFERVSEVEDVGEDAAAGEVVGAARASGARAPRRARAGHERPDVARPQNRATAPSHDQLAKPVVPHPQLDDGGGPAALGANLVRDVTDETLQLLRESGAVVVVADIVVARVDAVVVAVVLAAKVHHVLLFAVS